MTPQRRTADYSQYAHTDVTEHQDTECGHDARHPEHAHVRSGPDRAPLGRPLDGFAFTASDFVVEPKAARR